jgi:hypothetical protein
VKILFLCRVLDYGGAENQLVSWQENCRSGVDTGIAVHYSGGGLENELKGSNVAMFHLNKRGRWDILGFTWNCGGW